MEFVKDFLIYEAGALCGFFIAALMNAARAGQEIAIKFEEDKHLRLRHLYRLSPDLESVFDSAGC